MYSTYYPIGTSGHRASASAGYLPYPNYATPIYGNPGAFSLPFPPPAPHYMQPPIYSAPYVPEPQGPAQNPAPAVTTAASGGISAVLDYDPATMAAFICWCSFGMLGQSRTPTKEFEASFVAILHATRLPKSTIIIALEYINQRYSNSPSVSLQDSDMFVKIVVALVLANKFNDDNTFTNKSWCGASGVKIDVLNSMEKAWLAAVNWNLNVVNFQSNIETLEECWTSWVQKQASRPWASGFQTSHYNPTPSSAMAQDAYGNFSSVPSSPAYESTRSSSHYGYSSPVAASPIKFSQDWNAPAAHNFHYNSRPSPYAPYPQQQSIWAYGPSAYASGPPRMDSMYNGFSNPYYNCLATY
ncbi:hypothetical protein JCM33374_g5886 [Metschnikowia sp. JCM 33374]|nr:hypothetical protein JCM33374_g5886 [Metschnikowia sp. JCM 33374]